ncbi:hypothetical protein [Chryseobacterium sp. LAM-KRS1]|uniref:hypothetical protein n=1 Tax=Chryseobacterium sp. LAM-KRS1 TaxID=2715754 RepID=UPI0015552BD9|nr:hypothetical protein [Chryseobacterium sp. LAM-KRS1]
MLSFYCIYDDQPTPVYPEKIDLELAGDLFTPLQNKGILSRKPNREKVNAD